LKKGSEGEYGIRAKVKVAKNKVAPPFRAAEFDIIFGQGISRLGCLVDLAEQTGVITRKGAWYSYNGDNIAQGRDNTVKYLEEHAEFAENVDRQVREQLDMGAVVQANSVTPVDDDDEEEIFEEI
jgi:recombination protein RecA